MAFVFEIFAQARAFHNSGQLSEAEQFYRQVLELDSSHAEARNHLGVMLMQQGRLDEAVNSLLQARAQRPDSSEISRNLKHALAARDNQRGAVLAGQGKLVEAESWFRSALMMHPEFAGAHGNLGSVLRQQGKLDEAAACYRRVLELEPNRANTHDDLALTRQQQGRFQEAIAHYRRALELRPDLVYAHYNLGGLFVAQNRIDDAMACYRQAISLKPDFSDAHNGLGVALKAANRWDEAVACYRKALTLKPDFAAAHENLGVALMDRGHLDEAVRCYRTSLSLRPNVAQTYYNLGLTLARQSKLNEAVECYQQALALQPDYAAAHNNLGVALMETNRTDEAVASYRQTIALQPNSAEAHYNLGLALAHQWNLDEAAACHRRSLTLKPDFAPAHNHLGKILLNLCQVDEALACFDRSVELEPGFAEAQHSRSLALLTLGRYREGWPAYEWRWKCKGQAEPAPPQPRWNGAKLAGKTILLHSEQGLGDSLQFIRYAQLVKRRGGHVKIVCPPALTNLLASCPGVDSAFSEGQSVGDFDVHAPLLSLPNILGTTLETVPDQVPYLTPRAELVDQWKHRLGAEGAFKIGIAWQGNQAHPRDRARSVPLAQFVGIGSLPGVQLVSLQMGAGREQLRELSDQLPIIDLGDRPDDFHHTAAIMRNLDLVITCDSSPAHLGGALGVPVWLALAFASDWRWLLDRDDCPWYPTMRLFRQSRPGDWDGVFGTIERELAKLMNPDAASAQ